MKIQLAASLNQFAIDYEWRVRRNFASKCVNFTQLQGRRYHVGVNRQDQMDIGQPSYQVSGCFYHRNGRRKKKPDFKVLCFSRLYLSNCLLKSARPECLRLVAVAPSYLVTGAVYPVVIRPLVSLIALDLLRESNYSQPALGLSIMN